MVTLSAILHVAGFGAAVFLPRLIPRGPGGPPVYVVDLVALPVGPTTSLPPSGGGAAQGQPPPPAPAKPEKAIPLPERGRKPEPKAPDKKPQAKATPAPSKTAPPSKEKPAPPKDKPAENIATPPAAGGSPGTAGTGVGGATTGPAGGGLGGTGSGQADAATFYGNLLRQRIEGAWIRPLYPSNWPTQQPPTATVRITLTSSGRVTSFTLVAPSGDEAMDQSIMRAVQDAQPFPPFPPQLGRDVLSVSIDFVLPPK